MTQVRAAVACGFTDAGGIAAAAGVNPEQVREWLAGKTQPCRESRGRLRLHLEAIGAADIREGGQLPRAPKFAGKEYRVAGTRCDRWPTTDRQVKALTEAGADGMLAVVDLSSNHGLTRQIHYTRLLPPATTAPPGEDERVAAANLRYLAASMMRIANLLDGRQVAAGN